MNFWNNRILILLGFLIKFGLASALPATLPTSAELNLEIQTPTAAVELCGTTDYHVVRLFNLQSDAALGPQLEIRLPAGLQIVPGSVQFSYPTGAAWATIALPGNLPGGGVGWVLSALNQAIMQNGLPGVAAAPANSASIRFKTKTVCGFASGSKITFRASATNVPILEKTGDGIPLKNVPAPAFVTIQAMLNVAQPVGCSDEVPMTLNLTSTEKSGSRDSLWVSLPPGVTFVLGKYTPGLNAPADQPLVSQVTGRQQLSWKLLPNVVAGSPVMLTFYAQNFGSRCGALDTIFAQSSQAQTAICAADGSVCVAQVPTGTAMLVVEGYHPKFEWVDFDADFDAGTAAYHVDLKNVGNILHTRPTNFKFYRDNDGSKTLTPGDVKLHEDAVFFPLGPNDVQKLAGPLPVDLADLCHLIVVLEAPDMCLCETKSFPIDSISRHIPMKTVCSGAFIDLGVPMLPLHHYQWTPTTAITCDTCSFPKFFFQNPTDNPVAFMYKFLETAGDCWVESDVAATVLPMPHIVQQDTAICAGEFVTMSTTPAQKFLWFGSGITQPTLPMQTVSPIATSQYFVQITDGIGCFNIDTLMITVKDKPFAEIGPDTLGVCGNSDLLFHAFVNPNYSYAWSPASAVSNPSIPNPKFTGTATTKLILTVKTNQSDCVSRDTVLVIFTLAPTISVSQMTLANCFGDTAFVQFNGAQDYFLAPSAGVLFQNGHGSLVGLGPELNTVYKVLGYNQFGCYDSLFLTVNVPGKVGKSTTSATICAGETIQIFGKMRWLTGNYCEHFPTPSGCDSVACVALTVLDTLFSKLEFTLCPGDSVIANGKIYRQPGNFCETTPSLNGCDSTVCVAISAGQTSNLASTYEFTWATKPEVKLTVPTGLGMYEWLPADFLDCDTCANPTATLPDTVKNFTYSLIVTSSTGCKQKVPVTIRYAPPCYAENVLVPNAFTPDGDQTNDVFRALQPEGQEQPKSLEIYDRWGAQVFRSTDPVKTGWDGTDGAGNRLPSDTYLYVLLVGCPEGEGKKVGDVTLLR